MIVQHQELQLIAMINRLQEGWQRENVKLLIEYMDDRLTKKKSGSITFNTNRDGITEPGKHRIELTA